MVNWRSYNESLVRRGEVVLDFDVIDNWNNELDNNRNRNMNMNNGKEVALDDVTSEEVYDGSSRLKELLDNALENNNTHSEKKEQL